MMNKKDVLSIVLVFSFLILMLGVQAYCHVPVGFYREYRDATNELGI